MCFGQVCKTPDHVISHDTPPPNSNPPDPSTSSTPHSQYAAPSPSNHQPNTNTPRLHSAINSLNLNQPNQTSSDPIPNFINTLVDDLEPHTVPPTPANSLALEDTSTNSSENTNNLHASYLPTQHGPLGNGINNASFSTRPPWKPPQVSNLQWTWIEGNGPFITNGQSTCPHFEASDLESDTIAIVFNLDSLNESRPKAMQCHC